MDSFPCASEARVRGSIPGGSTLSRISPEWEAVCKTGVAGSTPECGSILGGGAHAMDSPARLRSSESSSGANAGAGTARVRNTANYADSSVNARDPASARTRPLIKLVSRAFRSPVCHRRGNKLLRASGSSGNCRGRDDAHL